MRYWRISLVYFIFFAELGIFLPLWPLYLSALSYTSMEIGQLMGLSMASKIIAPNLWAWYSDKTQQPVWIIRVGAVAALLSAVGVLWADSYWTMALVMFAYSFFWTAILPQLEALLLVQLKDETHRYSIVRSWGSIGFAMAVIMGGVIIDRWGPQEIVSTMIALLGCFLLCSMILLQAENRLSIFKYFQWKAVASVLSRPVFMKRRAPTQTVGNAETLTQLLKRNRRDVTVLFTICMLMIMSHAPYYTFFTIFLEQYGYSALAIGWLVSIGVIAEVFLFFIMPRWAGRVTAYQLLYVSLICASVRWIMIGLFPDNIPLLIALQLLHAATYGAFHVAVILLVAALFGDAHRSSGQAFYSSIGFGVGGALGAYLSGIAWEVVQPAQTFALATAVSLFGCLLAYRYLRRGRLSTLKL